MAKSSSSLAQTMTRLGELPTSIVNKARESKSLSFNVIFKIIGPKRLMTLDIFAIHVFKEY